jgi:hypothetical protein
MDKDTVDYLLSIGAIELAFVDSDGEEIYKMTKEAEKLVPEMYKEYMKTFNATLFLLWEKNLIDIVFDEDGEPLVGLNESSLDLTKVDDLQGDENAILQEIIETFLNKEE